MIEQTKYPVVKTLDISREELSKDLDIRDEDFVTVTLDTPCFFYKGPGKGLILSLRRFWGEHRGEEDDLNAIYLTVTISRREWRYVG